MRSWQCVVAQQAVQLNDSVVYFIPYRADDPEADAFIALEGVIANRVILHVGTLRPREIVNAAQSHFKEVYGDPYTVFLVANSKTSTDDLWRAACHIKCNCLKTRQLSLNKITVINARPSVFVFCSTLPLHTPIGLHVVPICR